MPECCHLLKSRLVVWPPPSDLGGSGKERKNIPANWDSFPNILQLFSHVKHIVLVEMAVEMEKEMGEISEHRSGSSRWLNLHFQFHEITPFKNCEVTLSAPQKQLRNLSLFVAAVAGPRTTAAASVSEATPQLNNFGQYQRSVERTICNLIFCHMESFNWFVLNSSLKSNYTFRRFIKSLVFVLSFHQCCSPLMPKYSDGEQGIGPGAARWRRCCALRVKRAQRRGFNQKTFHLQKWSCWLNQGFIFPNTIFHF